jgi:hypothetical protein
VIADNKMTQAKPRKANSPLKSFDKIYYTNIFYFLQGRTVLFKIKHSKIFLPDKIALFLVPFNELFHD